MHLYLIGYRGSGKSTVGRQLAQALHLTSVDTDDLIESSSGKSIRGIFESEGEVGFRDREQAVVEQVAQSKIPTVVALGGGAVLREANQRVIATSGRCVWLDAPAEQLYQRIQGDRTSTERRPQLSDRGGYAEVVDILAVRTPIYRELAQLIVGTAGKTPDEVVAEILDWVRFQAQ